MSRNPHNLSRWLEQKAPIKKLLQISLVSLVSMYAKLNIIAKPMLIYNVVFPFSAAAMEYTAFRPTCAITPVTTTVTPVSSTHIIMTCGSPSGNCNVLPPMIILPQERLSNRQVRGYVPGTLFACSSNGWIDEVLYEKWFDYFYWQSASSVAYWRWPLFSYINLYYWKSLKMWHSHTLPPCIYHTFVAIPRCGRV